MKWEGEKKEHSPEDKKYIYIYIYTHTHTHVFTASEINKLTVKPKEKQYLSSK